MADKKLSALNELAVPPANNDQVYIRDVSEEAALESKRITVANLLAGAGGAFLVVAAADTPTILKNRAAYIGDGTNDMGDVAGDEAEINTALGVADTVILCPGTYWINNPISMGSNQALIGGGAGTVIKIRDSKNATLSIIVNSDTTDGNTRIVISGLKLDGNKANNTSGNQDGIYFEKVAPSNAILGCEIKGCFVENFRRYGILINNSYNSTISGNHVWNCDNHGISISLSKNNTISGNICNKCEGTSVAGISVADADNTIQGNVCFGNWYGIAVWGNADSCIISNNICNENEDDGIAIFRDHNSITGNVCRKNGQNGIVVEGAGIDNVVVGNSCFENQQGDESDRAGISIRGNASYNLIVSNICRQGALAKKPDYGIEIESGSEENVIQGNDLHDGGAVSNLFDAGTLTEVRDNRGTEITDNKIYQRMKNTSGGTLVAGDVVILKSVAAGNEMTTTTIEGDQLVIGVVAETIVDTASGLVQVGGKTTVLKVDGTSDIAIGDLIGCFTTAKIGMKAAAGKMAFAIALEVYANNDSNGVIDALIIDKRQAI